MKYVYILCFLLLTFCILTSSQLSLFYALTGLNLWYNKMVPSLLPFMILSGIMVRMHLTQYLSDWLYPLLGPLFRVSRNGCYAILIGYLCGFPMGAKTVSDLLEQGMIDEKEAAYLLAFCNNIGPVYFCSFVLPLLGRRLLFPYVAGMYGIPLLYGIALRRTYYRSIPYAPTRSQNIAVGENLLQAMDASISSAAESMLKLCGYMILFNLFQLVPHLLTGHTPILLAPWLEITGGLSLLGDRMPLYTLLVLSFGGLCCIAQTYTCIHKSNLSIRSYILHKVVLFIFTAIYYLLWFFLSPSTFLR